MEYLNDQALVGPTDHYQSGEVHHTMSVIVISDSSENRENGHRQLADLKLIKSANDQNPTFKAKILFWRKLPTISSKWFRAGSGLVWSDKNNLVSQIYLLGYIETKLVNITKLPSSTVADLNYGVLVWTGLISDKLLRL